MQLIIIISTFRNVCDQGKNQSELDDPLTYSNKQYKSRKYSNRRQSASYSRGGRYIDPTEPWES